MAVNNDDIICEAAWPPLSAWKSTSPTSVGDVLKVVPVSRSWLERQFQQKLGRTPHDEIVRVRMDHARRLLLDTGEPIRRISERCGFSAVQNFNRAFQQSQGMSPAAYRRANLLH